MKNKLLLAILLSTNLLQCEHKSPDPCLLCVDPAFVITMLNTTGNKLGGFTVKATMAPGETLITNSSSRIWEVDSTYEIIGNAGLYNLEISSPQYQTINMDSIRVQAGRCGPNARILGIVAQGSRLSKRLSTAYIIAFDSSVVGCGN
jgi:hypothetical protein